MQINLNTVYFADLSPEAKAIALENNRYIDVSDSFWHENLEEHTLDIVLGILGFENLTYSFDVERYAEISTARFHYNKGMLKELKAQFPTWTAMHEVAEQLQALCKSYFYAYSFDIKSGRTCGFEHKQWGADWNHDVSPFESAIDEILKQLNQVLLKSFREEYEYRISDDAISATLIANELMFFENGSESYALNAA